MAAMMLVLGLCLATAWVCLIAGAVLSLSRYLGPTEALLTTGGALLALSALIGVIFFALRSRAPVPHPPVSGDKILQLITAIVHLGPRRAGVFVLLASVMAGAVGAVMIAKGGPAAGGRKPPSP